MTQMLLLKMASVRRLHCLALALILSGEIVAENVFDIGRTFILNPELLTWLEASWQCKQLNGTLGTIDRLETIPDLGFQGDWTLWIGLMTVQSANLTWDDGQRSSWTNWHSTATPQTSNIMCVSAVTRHPYAWLTKPCTDRLPSLCQVKQGSCQFKETLRASIMSYNNDIISGTSNQACLEQCRASTKYDCRSVEVHTKFNTCQLSNETRWSQPDSFITADRDWDYYQFTCVTGIFRSGYPYTPNGIDFLTTESGTSTEPLAPTSPYREGELVCRYILPPTENQTKTDSEQVQELKEIGTVLKQQRKLLTKISKSDPRSSSTYVGSLAVGLVLALAGALVVADILSCPRYIRQARNYGNHCSNCKFTKQKLRKKRGVNLVQLPERLPSVSASFVRPKLPDILRTPELGGDNHIDQVYSSRKSAVTCASPISTTCDPNCGEQQLHKGVKSKLLLRADNSVKPVEDFKDGQVKPVRSSALHGENVVVKRSKKRVLQSQSWTDV